MENDLNQCLKFKAGVGQHFRQVVIGTANLVEIVIAKPTLVLSTCFSMPNAMLIGEMPIKVLVQAIFPSHFKSLPKIVMGGLKATV